MKGKMFSFKFLLRFFGKIILENQSAELSQCKFIQFSNIHYRMSQISGKILSKFLLLQYPESFRLYEQT